MRLGSLALSAALIAACSGSPVKQETAIPDKDTLNSSIQSANAKNDHKSLINHCRNYLNYYPTANNTESVKNLLYESCKQFVITGESRAFLFIPYTTRKVPIEQFNETIRSYPYESYTPEYIYWFAEFLRENYDIETSEIQYLKIIDRYKDSNLADKALFRLGEISLSKFRGIEYSSDMLKDAELHFTRVIEEYPQSSLKEKAGQNLLRIHNLLADKIFESGVFYEKKGNLKGAALYFHEVLTKYPESAAAAKCKDKLHGSKN